ncbi:MAG: dipicolinate synthase subunit B [Clostridia bacterium]|nr:dipicolinate synthase subunit B [Clostridia bacterium]
MNLEGKKIGFAFTGSFCTFRKTIEQLEKLSKIKDVEIIPVMSYNSYSMDTKFGKAEDFIREIEEITKNKIIHTIEDAEPIGPKKMCDIFIIAPCTGNTMAKLANDIIDTPVTMAAKSHLRNENPLVIAVSTNNGLSGAGENIGKLLNRKHYYFVPFKQDNPITKPRSIVFDPSYLIKTLEYSLDREQIQPILL